MPSVWVSQTNDVQVFKHEDLLLPTIRTTWCKCKNVKIEKRREQNSLEFTVSWDDKDGNRQQEVVVFKHYPVWDTPSHL